MLVTCWSVKGGTGTTTVAVGLACVLARAGAAVTIVDLAGDVSAALGRPDPPPRGAGLSELLAGGADPLAPALRLAATPPEQGIALLHRGRIPWPEDPSAGERLAVALAGLSGVVVVDAGRVDSLPPGVGPGQALAACSTHSLLVVRRCFLGLRRASALPIRPSGVVLVGEPGRSLGRDDVEGALQMPVTVEIPWHDSIARAVDAGLLPHRVPDVLARALRGAA